ncbi:MAG: type IV pilus assembly protein FimV, partial [Lysobacterales bacterium]
TAILVTSVLPVKDPVLRLIVEVNWPSGRMLREYTLFLDPPTFAEPAPSPVIDQRTKPPVTDTSPMTGSGQKAQAELAPAPPSAETPEGAQKAARTTAGNETPAGVAEGDEYGPVQGGDTLWRIASNWSRGTGLDMSTVMIAIQRNNPHAFINSNINLLKQGIILRMPDSEDLAQISINEARSEVQEQNQASGRELVSPAVETPLVDEQSEPPATTSGTAEVEQPEGKLELVPPSESSDAESAYGSEEDSGEAVASTSVETLREEVARKEEALIVEQQQNEYLQQRIAELEVQAAAQQANVANDNLAGMEERLRGERLAKEAAARAGTAPSGRPQPVTPKKSTAWYSSKLVWLISLLVLGLAAYGGFLARRSFRADTVSNATGAGGGTHGGVKGEAAGIPKIMVPAKNKPAAEISGVTSGGRQVT